MTGHKKLKFCLIYPPLMFFIFFIVIFSGALSARGYSSSRIDLSGGWKAELLSCIPGEINCVEKLTGYPRIFTYEVPGNLRRMVPWFYGRVLLTKNFILLNDSLSEPVFFAEGFGGYGNIRINGRPVYLGADPSDLYTLKFRQSWNSPLLVYIPPGVIQKGNNLIEADLIIVDEKAGFFRGITAIDSRAFAEEGFFIQRMFAEWFVYGVGMIILFSVLYAIAGLLLNILPVEYLYFLFGALFSALYVFYFAPLPFILDHLMTHKILLSGGILGSVFSMIFFLHLGGIKIIHQYIFIAVGLIVAGFHYLPETYHSFSLVMKFTHVIVLIIFSSVAVIFTRLFLLPAKNSTHNRTTVFIMPAAWAAVLLSLLDLATRIFYLDFPFFFIYGSSLYIMFVLLMQDQNLMNSLSHEKEYYNRLLELERRQGIEIENSIKEERNRIYGDIHDHLGGRLAEIYLETDLMLKKDSLSRSSIVSVKRKLKRSIENLRSIISNVEDFDMIAENFTYGLNLILLRRYTDCGRTIEFSSDPEADTVFNPTDALLKQTAKKKALALFSIAQEVANNDLKYGKGVSDWKITFECDKSCDGGGSIRVQMKSASRYHEKIRRIGAGEKNILKRGESAGASISFLLERGFFSIDIVMPLNFTGR